MLGLLFCVFGAALKGVKGDVKIGVKREVKPCRKFVEDNDFVYAHVVARVEGRDSPVFDTYDSGKPLYFRANNSEFISGFNLGLRGACEGELRRITIPPNLAYKGESVEDLFGPYSTWIVDVDVLEVIKEQTL